MTHAYFNAKQAIDVNAEGMSVLHLTTHVLDGVQTEVDGMRGAGQRWEDTTPIRAHLVYQHKVGIHQSPCVYACGGGGRREGL